VEAADVWTVFQGLGAILAVALTVGFAAVNVMKRRRTASAADITDMTDLTDFLFDKPSNVRTRTPATKGWTTQVDEKLAEHGSLLIGIKETLETVAADAAGARRAAESEVQAQHVERQRVQKRDAAHGE
jgi:hypothetical protein